MFIIVGVFLFGFCLVGRSRGTRYGRRFFFVRTEEVRWEGVYETGVSAFSEFLRVFFFSGTFVYICVFGRR